MWSNQKQQKMFPYVKLTNLISFKIDFQKVDQLTGGKWLIHGTKRHKDKSVEKPGTPL